MRVVAVSGSCTGVVLGLHFIRKMVDLGCEFWSRWVMGNFFSWVWFGIFALFEEIIWIIRGLLCCWNFVVWYFEIVSFIFI